MATELMQKLLPLIFIVFLPVISSAQLILTTTIEKDGKTKQQISTANSRAAANQQVQKQMQQLWNEGYLAAQVSTQSELRDSVWVSIAAGPLYLWGKIRAGNVDVEATSFAGFKPRDFQNKKLRPADISNRMGRMLRFYLNHGYPFAMLKLDSLHWEDNTLLKASLKAEKGPLVKIDSLVNKGNLKLSQVFLETYLGIKPGDIYNESVIARIDNRLRELPFVAIKKPSQIFIFDEVAIIRLHLDEKKASQFNGVVGLLPNNEQTGRLLFTGEVTVRTRNSLKRAESIHAEWRRLQVQTQNARINLVFPFLFGTPIGVEAGVDIFRRDTTFLSVHSQLGVHYQLLGNDYIKAFFENRIGRILSTTPFENSTVPPPNLDVTAGMYGLEWMQERLNYRFVPRRGYRFVIKAGVGNRSIRQNPSLKPEVYQNLVLKSLQTLLQGQIATYVNPAGNHVIKTAFQGAILSGNALFQNELFRLGGLNSLRGFDDESIFASAFGIATAEYRYLLEENSFLFLFIHQAYYENQGVNQRLFDRPTGVGAGMSFETKAGIFSISYALGRQQSTGFEFRNAKIHFGLTSLF